MRSRNPFISESYQVQPHTTKYTWGFEGNGRNAIYTPETRIFRVEQRFSIMLYRLIMILNESPMRIPELS